MEDSHRHLKNLAINWSGHASSLIVMFFLSPYVVGKLSAVEYGIWGLLNILAGYMGVFDLGTRASVGRHVALYLGKKDNRGIDETIRAGFAVFTLTSAFIFIAGIVIGYFFPAFFKTVPSDQYGTIRYLLPFMAINIWLAAISTIYSSVLTAHSRFDLARIVDLASLAVRTVGTIYALRFGYGLVGLAAALILSNIVALAINRFFAGHAFHGLRSFPFLFSKQRMQELFGFGFFSFIYSISERVIGQTDLIIVGAFLSVSLVREYSIGATIVYYSAPFLDLISNTFFPSIQKSVASGEMGQAKKHFYNSLNISFSFGLLAYIGLAFFSKPFIRLWMLQSGFDLTSVSLSASVMTILALSKIPSLYLYQCDSILSAMGHIRFNAVRAVTEAIVNLSFSIFFVTVLGWGLAGVAAGTLVSRLIVATVSVPYFLFKKTGFPIRPFFSKVIFPAIASGAVFSLACYLLRKSSYIASWAGFAFLIAAALLIWCIIAFFVWLPSNRQTNFFNLVKGG